MSTISCLGSVYSATSVTQLKTSIDSLLFGIRQPSQIVLAIDGPISSQLSKLIESYSNRHFVDTISLESNQGLFAALNQALDICSSEIICRFDTDDINAADRLLRIEQAFLEDESIDIIGSYVLEFTNIKAGGIKYATKLVPTDHRSITRLMSFVNPLNHPAVAFRKSAILSLGRYPALPCFEDYALWLKARKSGLRFSNIPLPLVYMRRADTLSRRSGYSYAICEAHFYLWALKRSLLSRRCLPVYLFRIMLRLLPYPLQGFQSHLPWRKSLFSSPSDLVQWLSAEDE